MIICDESPSISDVRFMPDIIETMKSSTDTLNRLRNKQCSKHQITLTEFQHAIKEINSSRIEVKLAEICKKADIDVKCVYEEIESTYIPTLHILENFRSVDQFNEIWENIRENIEYVIQIINNFDEDLNSCENTRLDLIQANMTAYFDRLKSNGQWDDQKIIAFLNSESVYLNRTSVANFRKYAHIIKNLKLQSISKMLNYHQTWEQLLLTWRDHLVLKNVDIIVDITKSDEYQHPEVIQQWRYDTYQDLEKRDKLIISLYNNVVVGLPYNRTELVEFSTQIDAILEEKDNRKELFMSKTKFHFDELIDRLEKRLIEMKEFLFLETSCNEEQFIKTFSKFIGEGSESYEVDCYQILHDDNIQMTENLKHMGDVHCTMLTFLYTICDLWDCNDDKVNVERDALLGEIDNKRNVHKNLVKISEYTIDQCIGKISKYTTHSQVDKMQKKLSTYLEKLEAEFSEFYSDVMKIVSIYPKTCLNQVRGYESKMLSLIGLKHCGRDQQKFFMEVDGKKFIKYVEHYSLLITPTQLVVEDPTITELCEKIKDEARKWLVEHIVSNETNLLKNSSELASKLTREFSQEHDLRIALHTPRKDIINDELNERKNAIDSFKDMFEQFYEISSKCEIYVKSVSEKFNEKANALIKSIEKMIEKADKGYLTITKSATIIELHETQSVSLLKQENKLSGITRSILAALDKETKCMRKGEDNFLNYANEGHFGFCEKFKLYQEFCEIKERLRSVTQQTRRLVKSQEVAKAKQIASVIQQHKAYYKHCLVGLYFLEMKSNHLAFCRLKIKSAISYGNKDLRQSQNMTKSLKNIVKKFSAAETGFPPLVYNICSKYIEIFNLFRKVINFMNYRCSSITVPHNTSLMELNQKYESFGSADADIEKTIEFAKEIIQMTTRKKDDNIPDHVDRKNDNNWVADKADVEKKYVTGRLGCIYGVGANMMDIPAHPWAGVCATLTTSNKSYWLSKNPEGLMALQDIKDRRRANSDDSTVSTIEEESSESVDANHETKIKEIAKRIRKSVTPAIPSHPFGDKRETSGLSERLRRLKTLTEGIINNLPEKPSDGTKNNRVLPSIDPKSVKYTFARRHSGNQFDMQKAITLSKTVDLMSKAKRRRSSAYFRQTHKIPIYDFMIISEEDLEKVVFDPTTFFRLRKRTYNVEDLSQNIISVIEKVKFFLLHLQEDFIVSSIVFYKQKHMSIKYPKKIEPTCDAAIEQFRRTLESYLDETRSHCHECIETIKSSLKSLYELFDGCPYIIFGKVFSEAKNILLGEAQVYLGQRNEELKENTFLKNTLWKLLRPCLALPQNKEELDQICAKELNRRKTIENTSKPRFEEGMSKLIEHYEKYVTDINYCAGELLKVADDAIQIEDIRKITTDEENTFEVKKRLRQNMALTAPRQVRVVQLNKMNAYVPLPNINKNENTGSLDGEVQNEVVSYNKLNKTKARLSLPITEERDKCLMNYRELFKVTTSDCKKLFEDSVCAESHWSKRWDRSVIELKQLVHSIEHEH